MKVYVAAPGQHNWPIIPDDIQDRLITILTENFNDEKFEVSLKRTRKKTNEKHPIKQHLAIGLHSVTRCLKQKKCLLVLVCNTLTPIILTKPILLLSQINSIPSIRLKNLSSFLIKTFNIPHCSIIGFKLSCQENQQLQNLVNKLLEIINGCEKPVESSVKFIPGKILAPYQNPKRISSGIQKKKKNK